MRAALEEALQGLAEGGIPIGSVLVREYSRNQRSCHWLGLLKGKFLADGFTL